ncbi:hypothetical protein [Colwellia sp. MEBiC06753]
MLNYFSVCPVKPVATDIKRAVKQLGRKVKAEFEISISPTQMLEDSLYRQTMLHELRTIGDDEINAQIDALSHFIAIYKN